MNKNCNHYQRPVLIYADCCKKWFECHICHNDQSTHEMDRYKVSKIKCSKCETEQPVSNQCINLICEYASQFTSYFCSMCKLYSNDKNKDIYHCDQCGICRVGKRETYFHCDQCKMCLNVGSKEDHKCLSNKFDKECPVCRCNLFTSQSPVINFKNCAHCMCSDCYLQYIKDQWVCPLCKKSLHDMSRTWDNVDILVQTLKMPEEYAKTTVDILCNDCNKKSSNIKYHFQYHKCSECRSYNTNITHTYNPPIYNIRPPTEPSPTDPPTDPSPTDPSPTDPPTDPPTH